MLTKRLPFTGATRMDTMVAILDREPPPLSEVSNAYPALPLLQQLVSKCLRKDVKDRYHAANELLGELKNAREQVKSGLPGARIANPVQAAGHTLEAAPPSHYV